MSRKTNKYNTESPAEPPSSEVVKTKASMVREAGAIYRVSNPMAQRASDEQAYRTEAELLCAELDATMERILARTRGIRSDIKVIRNEIAATRTTGVQP
jgi:hypothetical protein